MKRNRLIFTLFVAIAVIITACTDEFLTREPLGQFGQPSLENQDGVEGILLGAYAMIDGSGLNGTDDWNVTVENWAFNLASDDALKGTDAGDQPEQSFIEGYDFQAFNGHITNRWRALYKGIARSNDAITSAQRVEDIPEERRAQIIAEATFLRGIFHMEARKMWRMPAYIGDDVYDVNDVESTKVPNDREIWPLIEADFEAAAAGLPETPPNGQVGRPTAWAAKAFLAKAKMYQGWNDDGSANTAKLQEAKVLLDEIVDSGEFSLVPNFNDNFKVATRNNEESIFEIQYAVSSAADQASSRGMGLAHPYTDPWGCCGFYQVSQNLVNAYKTEGGLPLLDTFDDADVTSATDPATTLSTYTEPLDPRLDHTVGRPGILYKGFKIYQTDFVRDLSYAGPFFSMKHVAEEFGPGGWGNLTANNYRYMRYGMVILWLAEAEVELGNLERARELINLIRERASNPADFVQKAEQGSERNQYTLVEGETAANYEISQYNTPFADQATARKAVRFETRLEFAMEGHRYWDLVRWGVAAETLNAYIASESNHRNYLAGKSFVEGKHEYFPIPSQAIDRSTVDGAPTLTQDPAY